MSYILDACDVMINIDDVEPSYNCLSKLYTPEAVEGFTGAIQSMTREVWLGIPPHIRIAPTTVNIDNFFTAQITWN